MSDAKLVKNNQGQIIPTDLRSFLDIGRITSPHGIAGEVRVFPMTDRIERFEALSECFLTTPDGQNRRLIRILKTRQNLPNILIRIEGIEDRTAAEKLRGCLLSVDRANAIVLPEGSHFICDLIGCTVSDQLHGILGQLSDVLQNSAHDVYVVTIHGQPDLLIPAIKAAIQHIDIDARRIEVTLPDGLYEIYRPDRVNG